MSKDFADFLFERILVLRSTHQGARVLFCDSTENHYVHNCMTTERFFSTRSVNIVSNTRRNENPCMYEQFSTIPSTNYGFGQDQMNWQEVVNFFRQFFRLHQRPDCGRNPRGKWSARNGVHPQKVTMIYNETVKNFPSTVLSHKQTLLSTSNPVNRLVANNPQ